jgi:hypothetical protein
LKPESYCCFKYKNNITEIVKFFVELKSLGIIIDNKMYEYLHMINIPSLKEIHFPDVSPEFIKIMQYKTELIINKRFSNNNINFNIKTINDLRKLFRYGSVNELIQYSTTNNKFMPDELCFFNSLQNSYEVIIYVLEKYKYVPSIYDIMYLEKSEIRVYLMKRFYSKKIDI